MKKCKILAVMLSVSMVLGQLAPLSVMAAEYENGTQITSTVTAGTDWLNDEWNWGDDSERIDNDSVMWWDDAEVVTYSEEESDADDIALYEMEAEEGIVDSDEAEVLSETETETEAAERPQPGTTVRYNDQITYVVNDDGETCSVGCTDQNISGTLEIPGELDGLTVTDIAFAGFFNCGNLEHVILPDTLTTIGAGAFGSVGLTEIYIPASVTKIDFDIALMQQSGPTLGCPMLQSINVDADNPEYTSVDGVLFDQSQTTLLTYPAGKPGAYDVPEGVTTIGALAFSFCGLIPWITGVDEASAFNIRSLPETLEEIGAGAFNLSMLTSITIPKNVKKISWDLTATNMPSFYLSPLLQTIEVEAENTEFASSEGILYNKDMTYLIQYPIGSPNTEYEMPDSVKAIAAAAFYEDAMSDIGFEVTLEKIKCSSNLEVIGTGAFYANYSLKEIELPVTLQEIAPYAFYNVRTLTDVYYGGTETDKNQISIWEQNASLLNATWHYKEPDQKTDEVSWKLEEGVLTVSGTGAMESYAKAVKQPWYKERNQITSVVIEEGVTEIGDFSFYGLNNLKSVSIADSVTKIDQYAFKNCASLVDIQLPAEIVSISESAFYGCTSLKTMTFPESLTAIGDYAFARCTALHKLAFEGEAPKIQANAFAGVRASASYSIDKTSWRSGYCKNYGGEIEWNRPLSWVIEDHVLTISDNRCMTNYDSVTQTPWYTNRNEVTSIVFSDYITDIADYAFYGFNNLKSVQFQEGLESIGDYAFKNCRQLTEMTIPSTIEKIGESAFYGCIGLKNVTFPDGMIEIGDYAFARNSNLKTIQFDGAAPSIAEHVFSGVKAKVVYPDDESSWNEETKKNYGGSLQWDDEEKQQCGDSAYWKVENQVLTISGSGAMDNYDNAAECPWSDERANITQIVVEEGVTSIGNFAFYGMTNLTEISLADSVTSIGAYAFKNDSKLENVVLPSELSEIDESAFYGSLKLSSVIIPEKVTKIGDYAFSRCTALKDITFDGDAPEIASYAFNKVTANVVYAGDNTTWTDANKQNYGGKLTWSEKE